MKSVLCGGRIYSLYVDAVSVARLCTQRACTSSLRMTQQCRHM